MKQLQEQINEALNQRKTPSTNPKFEIDWNVFCEKFIDELKRNSVDEVSDVSGIQVICEWIKKGKKSLFLSGSVGNGKTTIAKALRDAHNHWVDGYIHERLLANFVTAKQVVGLSMGNEQGKKNEALQNLYKQNPLVIDDVGAEQTEVNDYGTIKTPLIDLLEHRYLKRYATIITSNLNIDQIKEKYGVRVQDRINEQYSIIGFNQKSFRK